MTTTSSCVDGRANATATGPKDKPLSYLSRHPPQPLYRTEVGRHADTSASRGDHRLPTQQRSWSAQNGDAMAPGTPRLFVLGRLRLIIAIGRARYFLGFRSLAVVFGCEELLDNGAHRQVPRLGIVCGGRHALGVDLDPRRQPGLGPEHLPFCGDPPPYPGHVLRSIPAGAVLPGSGTRDNGKTWTTTRIRHRSTSEPRTPPE